MTKYNLMRSLFQNDADIIACAIMLSYEQFQGKELFRQIAERIIREDYGTVSAVDIVRQDTPNVFISFKGRMESDARYPFYTRLHDVKKMTLVNFASSVFISGIRIATIYEEGNDLKQWFEYNLAMGNIEIDIILTNPHSAAAQDAAFYKMNPDGRKVPTDQIILTNLNKLYQFMQNNPAARINLYLTNIVLPYGLMITDHKNKANNNMKVDLYAADVRDERRPSFYMLQQNEATRELYSFFVDNAKTIMRRHSYAWHGHPDVGWIKKQRIIHRAMSGPEYLPHTKRSVDACLAAGLPMEIDLLELADGKIIIGRTDQDISAYGINKNLSECKTADIRRINKKNGEEKILFLDEFLKLVAGRVPVLLEIKTGRHGELSEETTEYVNKVMSTVESYLNKFIPQPRSENDYGCHVAIHSSNPYVLKLIREIDCTIPVGIISMNFTRIGEGIEKEFIDLHKNAGYLDIIKPDFVSYDIRDIENGTARRVCSKEGIPLLAWTIRDEDDQQKAMDYGCDSIIIEGSKDYLK